jgi:predicted RNA-binding Zn ribbon-like protein
VANPAPGQLKLVQDFVNSADLMDGTDDIAEPGALAEWLRLRGLIDPATELAGSDVEHALAIREALRRLLLANNGAVVYPVDLATLNRAAAESALRPRFLPDRSVRLEPEAAGVAGALGRILGIATTAMADGSWAQLKACADHDCAWAFWDQSKNHSGHWCRMGACGNRAKARRYRERRRSGGELGESALDG